MLMIDRAAPIRVLAVDDHPLIRGGIVTLVESHPDLKLVAEASSGREAIVEFRRHRPDITLMDVQMPDMTGIEALIAIRAEFPQAKIIMLTTFGGDALATRALKAGAQAYVLKSLVRKELAEVIRAVHGGFKRVQIDVAASLADHTADLPLSDRETQVLKLVATGNSNKKVGYHLSINEETVKGHVKNILSKLGASDRTHAVTVGLRRGIIGLD
jgi:DNA-binding NarL/FixJ family response regulator